MMETSTFTGEAGFSMGNSAKHFPLNLSGFAAT
jgi:hypothetical protein